MVFLELRLRQLELLVDPAQFKFKQSHPTAAIKLT